MMKHWSRRQFLRSGAALGLAAGAPAGAAQADRPVRLGFVGVGGRGTHLLRVALSLKGVEVPALCDINQDHLTRAQGVVEKAGHPRPEAYARGPEDYRRLVDRTDLDAVVTATPWDLHTPVMLAAMRAGKYGATEVPAALTLEDCWALVHTSEETGMPCMMLENFCYFRTVLMILNMSQQGVFGDLVHCEGGYQHDNRAVMYGPDGTPTWRGEQWRHRNGNLYPTHPLGPMAQWLNVHRGDRFEYLVSMSTGAQSMHAYLGKMFGPDHPITRFPHAQGDVNTTLIRTVNGRTITLYLDTQTPRPYDLIFRVQGTRGIYSGSLDRIYIEDRSPKPETWEDVGPYQQQYEHPLWKQVGAAAEQAVGAFGGADTLCLKEFVDAARTRTQTPIDAYDTAAWSAVLPLSEESVANQSRAVACPDFTNGQWKTRTPRAIVRG